MFVSLTLAYALLALTFVLVILAIVENSIPTQYKSEAEFIGSAGVGLAAALALQTPWLIALVGAANIPLIIGLLLAFLIAHGIVTFGKYLASIRDAAWQLEPRSV